MNCGNNLYLLANRLRARPAPICPLSRERETMANGAVVLPVETAIHKPIRIIEFKHLNVISPL